MSEPSVSKTHAVNDETNAELVTHMTADAAYLESRGLLYVAARMKVAAQRLEASPSKEEIIEWMARAIFNQHNRLTPENSTWHVVPEQTREIFREIARHEVETAQKS